MYFIFWCCSRINKWRKSERVKELKVWNRRLFYSFQMTVKTIGITVECTRMPDPTEVKYSPPYLFSGVGEGLAISLFSPLPRCLTFSNYPLWSQVSKWVTTGVARLVTSQNRLSWHLGHIFIITATFTYAGKEFLLLPGIILTELTRVYIYNVVFLIFVRDSSCNTNISNKHHIFRFYYFFWCSFVLSVSLACACLLGKPWSELTWQSLYTAAE